MSKSENIFDILQNPDGLKQIFGQEELPSFRDVEVVRLDLRLEERTACLVLDLSEYPKDAPKKWKALNANVCQVELTMFALEAVSIRGLCYPFKSDLKVVRQPDGSLEAQVENEKSFVAIKSEFIRLNKVSAYQQPSGVPDSDDIP
jgi:hypothetical protein